MLRLVFAALLTPGLWQTLFGRGRRGVGFLAASVLLLASAPLVGAPALYLWILVILVSIVDAVRLGLRGDFKARWGAAAGHLAAYFAVLGLVRTFYLETFKIPSGGMTPTLVVGDHIAVEKFRRSPARGDLIVFERDGQDWISRVVALGGDRVMVQRGRLVLNGAVVAAEDRGNCLISDFEEHESSWFTRDGKCYVERIGEREATIFIASGDTLAKDETFEVPPGHAFVVGDNRRDSYDSRYVGPVPLSKVLGTPSFIWWSSGPGVNWDRVGRRLP
jgi:signal peptidase I